MLSVERHIAYLVTRHDCVIVPGFGAFVSFYESARYDETKGIYFPPERRLGFNHDIDHNDAMLAASVARRESVSYERAAETVHTQVKSWIIQLNESGSLAFEGLGAFTVDSDGSWQFTPSQVNSLANNAYHGLPRLTFAPVISAEQPDSSSEKHVLRRISSRLIRAAASVAIIVSVVAAMLTFIVTPDSPLYYASLFPAHHASQPTLLADRPIIQPADAELRIAMLDDDVTTSANDKTVAEVPQTTDNSDHRYFLVVASLANMNEVDRYLAGLPDDQREQMNVLKGDNRYRVYISSGSTYDEANGNRNLPGFESSYPGAWVYVKR